MTTTRAKHCPCGDKMTTYAYGDIQTDCRRHSPAGVWRHGLLRRRIGCHLFLFICLLLVPEAIRAGSIYTAYNASEEAHAKVDGTTFLMKFGYLPQSDRETGALRTAEELIKAVETFQQFAQLPVTGKLDKLTLQKMLAQRCGMADIMNVKSNAQHLRRHWYRRQFRRHIRHKRYAFGPSKWENKQQVTYR
ncbi:hypothetical protein LSAT2_015393 [Lamellibrachia satsuma]|nr:hypothetical protein LSAT2_015393 [Lamellibrachia satsuma]